MSLTKREIPEPTILLYLQDAVQTEIGKYIRDICKRDYEREAIQDAANDYIARHMRALQEGHLTSDAR